MWAMVPLGMCQITPSSSRMLVVRSVTFSTTPVRPDASMVSPTANWPSSSMNRPDRKSRTTLWAPKARAAPTIPAPAINGASAMPKEPMTIDAARVQIVALAMLRSSTASPLAWPAVGGHVDAAARSGEAFDEVIDGAPDDTRHDPRQHHDHEDLGQVVDHEVGRPGGGARGRSGRGPAPARVAGVARIAAASVTVMAAPSVPGGPRAVADRRAGRQTARP